RCYRDWSSDVCSSDLELDAYANILENCPEGLVACVSDSYDIYNAVRNLWGDALHDKVLQRAGTLVIRPDSGEAVTVLEELFKIRSEERRVGKECTYMW